MTDFAQTLARVLFSETVRWLAIGAILSLMAESTWRYFHERKAGMKEQRMMNTADLIRERAITEAVQELCQLARATDNLWVLSEAILVLKGEREEKG